MSVSKPHSVQALRRLEARGGWDEADLNDFAIVEGTLEQYEDALRQGLIIKERVNELEEQLQSERALADVFRRVLAQGHSLAGLALTIPEQSVALTDAEFDVVWEALDAIDGENYTLKVGSNPAKERP